MTYRDRRAARADRLDAWADKRRVDATRTLTSQPDLRHDWAFITQPGHIPERARMNAADDRALRSLDKADAMSSRADEIRRQADNAIYSDDPDAIDRLTAKIADLTATRDARKAANDAYRKAHRADLAALTPYARDQAIPFPSYSITNMTGNIGRLRARLDQLKKPRRTTFAASRRDPDSCYRCDYAKVDHDPHAVVTSVLLCPRVGA